MVRAWPLVLLLSASCSWLDGQDNFEQQRMERLQPQRNVALPREAQAPEVEGVTRTEREPLTPLTTTALLPEGEPGLVVLVVLDTVRSSHLGMCGYSRRTSPVLMTMRRMGGSFTCNAYSPATWTIPSHASYFTGLPVSEHDMHRKGLRLSDDYETLAEIFEGRGYQTLLISSNPVLKEATGLQQGFQRVLIAHGLAGPLRGVGMAKALKSELALTDKTRPLFVVLNIFDAHEPYAPIPADTPGFVERPAFFYHTKERTLDNPYYAFVQGELPEDQAATWLQEATDGYDYGVALADRSAGRMLKMLERNGWIDHGSRLVVTSDHGENLGEHGAIRHDGPPWEGVSRVPFLYVDTQRAKPLPLPEPLAAATLFDLLTTGALPEVPRPVMSSSVAHGTPDPRYADAVAVWPAAGEKLMWKNGETKRYDLAADPEGLKALEPGAHAASATLAEAVERHMASKDRAFAKEVVPEVETMLGELGYTD